MNTLLSFIFVISLITFLVTGIIWIIKKISSKPTRTGKTSLISLVVAVVSFGLFGYVSGSFSSSNSSSSSSSSSSKTSSLSKSSNSSSSEKKSSSSSSSASSSSSQKVTMEDQNALESAKEYVDQQYLSQKGLYQQLTSSDGDGFKPEAAQYAIDQLNNKYHINWDKVALKSAENYQSEQHMSRNDIYQQLISSDGEQFTTSQAQYAINHLPQ